MLKFDQKVDFLKKDTFFSWKTRIIASTDLETWHIVGQRKDGTPTWYTPRTPPARLTPRKWGVKFSINFWRVWCVFFFAIFLAQSIARLMLLLKTTPLGSDTGGRNALKLRLKIFPPCFFAFFGFFHASITENPALGTFLLLPTSRPFQRCIAHAPPMIFSTFFWKIVFLKKCEKSTYLVFFHGMCISTKNWVLGHFRCFWGRLIRICCLSNF